MERGIQTYLGFSYADRLHIATHHHNEPLVPRDRVHGVRGRIDLFGDEVLPLRERGRPRGASTRCSTTSVEGIVISLIFSYRNPAHEQRVREIVEEEKAKREPQRQLPGLRLLRALPLAPRLPAPQHDRDRGLRRRALARHPARRPRPHQGARRRLRAARHGLARRHDLDRRRPARDDARLRPDRRRRRRALARRPDRPEQRALHRHRRHLVRHRAADRQALRGDDDPGHGEIPAQHAAGPDRLGRRRLRLLRPHRPERAPARDRPRLGRAR